MTSILLGAILGLNVAVADVRVAVKTPHVNVVLSGCGGHHSSHSKQHRSYHKKPIASRSVHWVWIPRHKVFHGNHYHWNSGYWRLDKNKKTHRR